MRGVLAVLALAACTSAPAVVPQAPVPSGPPRLVLRGDGLVLEAAGQRSALPFGSGTGAVVPALAEVTGAAVAQRPVPCPGGPRVQVDGPDATALFDGDRFVGWSTTAGRWRTAEGAGVGSPVSDVPGAQVSGARFTAPSGLAGRLTDGRVVALTGGETCG